jgi:hypothetical protein
LQTTQKADSIDGGFIGDQINVLLAAAAFKLRKWMRMIVFCFYWLRSILKITPET